MARKSNYSYNINRGPILRDDGTNYMDMEFESQKRSKVYTTEIINQILKDIKKGKKADMNPFFHGKIEWRNADIVFEYTAKEYEEIQKCTDDPLYFIETYCAFLTDYGRKTVQLRDYQKNAVHLICDEVYDEKLDIVIPKNRRVIFLQSRQTGKTTTTAAAFCWYLCFHYDRNAMVVANKGQTATEVFKKIKDIFKYLPFFLKPGVLSVSDEGVSFENGCSLRCSATSDTPATGDTLHMLLIDECALIPANKINNFWASVFPTMSSSNLSQVIVLSTPRGKHNLYYDLYSGAVSGKNGFVHQRVDYWEVPGHDTEEWKQEQISAFGEALFNQEFGLSFEEDVSKLIAPRDLKFMNRIKKEFVVHDLYNVPWVLSQKIYWHPDFDPNHMTQEELLNSRFLLQVDTAQGKEAGAKGQEDTDWNVINIFKIEFMSSSKIRTNREGYKKVELKDCIRLRQIGVYMDQDNDEETCALAAQNLVFNVFKCGTEIGKDDIDNCRIMVELNFNGANWIKRFIGHDNFYNALIIKTLHSQKATVPEFGFKTVGGSHGKGYWCETGAKLIAKRQIIVSQDHTVPAQSTIQQLEAFGKNKNRVYEGSCMHDDIATTVLFASMVFEQPQFMQWVEDWYEEIRYQNISDAMKKSIDDIDYFLETYTVQTVTEVDGMEEDELYDIYEESINAFNRPGRMNFQSSDTSNMSNNIYIQSRQSSVSGPYTGGTGSRYRPNMPKNPWSNRR